MKIDESFVCSDKNLRDSFFKSALLRSKTSTTSESSIDEYMFVFLYFLNKGSTVTYFVIYFHQHYLHH
jgi:hypothetical protein